MTKPIPGPERSRKTIVRSRTVSRPSLSPRSRKSIHAFAKLAREFCLHIERRGRMGSRRFLMHCAQLLPKIYGAALQLPLPETHLLDSEDRTTLVQWQTLRGSIRSKVDRFDLYTEVFDPYNRSDQSAVVASLSDDLADIYRELAAGLQCYKMRRSREAAWEWRFGFDHHWGWHATGAIKALYWLHRSGWTKPAPLKSAPHGHPKRDQTN